MNASRFVYTLLLYALLPRALVHLWWRARRQPAYLDMSASVSAVTLLLHVRH